MDETKESRVKSQESEESRVKSQESEESRVKSQESDRVSSGEAKSAGKKDEVDFGNPLDEEKTLLAWKSAARLHKKRSREFFTTIGSMVFLLSIILAFFKEFLAILATWSVAFFAYVLASTRPETVDHTITTRGVKTEKNKYRWGELMRFWFEEKWGQTILYIETFRAFPGRLMMILGETPKEKIKQVLVKKIPYDKPEATFTDKAGKWLSDKVPLEVETSASAAISK